MREIETSPQPFGEFLLRARLVREKAAPHRVPGAPLSAAQFSNEPRRTTRPVTMPVRDLTVRAGAPTLRQGSRAYLPAL